MNNFIPAARSGMLLLLLLIAAAACRKSSNPEVRRLVDDEYITVPMRLASSTGLRDGYYINGTLLFLASGQNTDASEATIDSLMVSYTIETGVPARFVSGNYRFTTRDALFRGKVTAEALTFHGGQGGLPALGGRFTFTAGEKEIFEIYLPPVEIRKKIPPRSGEPEPHPE